eukprot:TRINITY_DN11360_c0_g1_i1.p3 TRINITY_DN11360_c0_g1~~TRINITY_DN11360_c0_g1_i1.p3  ORF type:complete len:101 (-),score=8.32 TRINITY_DN11360_c0_g1_i1:97-399(-)
MWASGSGGAAHQGRSQCQQGTETRQQHTTADRLLEEQLASGAGTGQGRGQRGQTKRKENQPHPDVHCFRESGAVPGLDHIRRITHQSTGSVSCATRHLCC